MMYKKPRLRRYILLSLALHVLLVWLWRFLPPDEAKVSPPVTVRVLTPPPSRSQPPKRPQVARQRPPEAPKVQPKPPQAQPKPPQALPQPPRPKKPSGVLVDLPKPVREERPNDARIVSRYDSKAQDVGPGASEARKPSGQNPRDMPPELALPERYSTRPDTRPQSAPTPPTPAQPPVTANRSRVTPAAPPRPKPPSTVARVTPEKRVPRVSRKPALQPRPRRHTSPPPVTPDKLPPPRTTPEQRRFPMTRQQEIAMLQRDPQRQGRSGKAQKQALDEHFARMEERRPSFDAPGVYERGPERSGEGRGDVGGGKYRSVGSYGLKHFSYLSSLQRKIELVFSVPAFVSGSGAIGVPIVGFTILRNGTLAEAVLLRSSGHPVLDRALINAVRCAAPYYPFPQNLPDPSISIRVYATVS